MENNAQDVKVSVQKLRDMLRSENSEILNSSTISAKFSQAANSSYDPFNDGFHDHNGPFGDHFRDTPDPFHDTFRDRP